jgi:hypothetical protein
MIFLQPSKCWDYSHVTPCPAENVTCLKKKKEKDNAGKFFVRAGDIA